MPNRYRDEPPPTAVEPPEIPVVASTVSVRLGKIKDWTRLQTSDSSTASNNWKTPSAQINLRRELNSLYFSRSSCLSTPRFFSQIFYREKFGFAVDVMAHLRREFMHAIWDLLISPEFIHAYFHGLGIDVTMTSNGLFSGVSSLTAQIILKIMIFTLPLCSRCVSHVSVVIRVH
jgi:hypothetical protein